MWHMAQVPEQGEHGRKEEKWTGTPPKFDPKVKSSFLKTFNSKNSSQWDGHHLYAWEDMPGWEWEMCLILTY